jgi:putative ABC transport system permease protein
LASVEEKSAAVRIHGIHPALEDSATLFYKKVREGRAFSGPDSREVIAGTGLAELLNASTGDTLVLLSQAADGSMANDLYPIVGLFDSGDPLSDRSALYLPLLTAQQFLVLPDQIHEIAVIVRHLDDVEPTVRHIEDLLSRPDIEAASWREFAKSFYHAMQADKEGMWIMIFVVMLIVAVGVLNTVLMSVLERTREYGMLKAVGSRPKTIFMLVIWEVQILILFSLVIGSVLAYAANSFIAAHGFSLPQAFSFGGVEFKTMTAEVNARSFTLSGLTVLVSATLISVFPALRAARIKPAKAMRDA